MLQYELLSLAISTAYSGENTLRALFDELGGRIQPDPQTRRTKCIKKLEIDLSNNHPRRYRNTDLQTIFDIVWPDTLFVTNKTPSLSHLYSALMEDEGDLFRFRTERTTEYVNLASTFDPTSLVAWKIANDIHENKEIDIHDLQKIIQAQQPFHTSTAIENVHYAEGHVHLNGMNVDGVILMHELWKNLSAPSAGDTDIVRISALSHFLFSSPQIQIEGKQLAKPSILRRLVKEIINGDPSSNDPKVNWSWIIQDEPTAEGVNWYWLRQQIGSAIANGDSPSAWLWFHIFLSWQYQHKSASPTLRILIHYIQGSLMKLRKNLIADGVGLASFKKANGAPLRASNRSVGGLSNARMLLQGKEDRAEIKIGIDFFQNAKSEHPIKLSNFLDQLCQSQGLQLSPNPDNSFEAYKTLTDRWHGCVSFSRQACHIKLNGRQTLWNEAKKISEAMHTSTTMNQIHPLNFLLYDTCLFRNNWIRGLDVVGDENEARIEVYAPMLRWLRREVPSGDSFLDIGEPPSRPYLSIHAGEDYAHPLSGLRHVDETVLFCEMERGDRLGHALALGISPTLWLDRHGDVLLDASEHLDNLVWAWHHAKDMLSTQAAKLAIDAIPIMENRIKAIASHVSWAKSNLEDPELLTALHRAWHFRRNCPLQVSEHNSSGFPDERIQIGAPDHLLLKPNIIGNNDLTLAKKIYINRNSVFADELKKEPTVLIRQSDDAPTVITHDRDLNLIFDHDSIQEKELMYALQDFLLGKYSLLGLIIETNPTSNLYISRLNDYSEHPIFRWNPPNPGSIEPGQQHNIYSLRKGPMAVTINTDDPGIMPTTLRTEFSLIKIAARKHDADPAVITAWLEKIRTKGITEYDEKHVSVWQR